MKSRFGACLLATLVVLTGCDVFKEEFEIDTSEAVVLSQQLSQMSDSDFSAVPIAGKATFLGHTQITANPTGGESILRGDATIIVDFGKNKVTGSAGSFIGVNGEGKYGTYEGSISIATGTIGAALPNDVTAIYSGRLTGNGDQFILLGEVNGRLKGNPIAGVSLHEPDSVIGQNGQLVSGTVTMQGVN